MNAIGHAVLERRPEARVAYLATETFVNDLISSLRRDRMEEFKQRLRRVDVLIVDDVQFLAGRERTQEEFFHTFNTLHAQRAQIVLTSDKVPKDIPGLEERLRNRFEWGLIADIQPPDMETRVAILEKKAEIEGISISHEVALFLADQMASNVRELEGALTRLGAHASLHRHEITVDYAREVAAEPAPGATVAGHLRRHRGRGLRALRAPADRPRLAPAQPPRRAATPGRDVPLPPAAQRVVPSPRRALPARSLDRDPRRDHRSSIA